MYNSIFIHVSLSTFLFELERIWSGNTIIVNPSGDRSRIAHPNLKVPVLDIIACLIDTILQNQALTLKNKPAFTCFSEDHIRQIDCNCELIFG